MVQLDEQGEEHLDCFGCGYRIKKPLHKLKTRHLMVKGVRGTSIIVMYNKEKLLEYRTSSFF